MAYSPELEICEPSGFRHQTIRYGRRMSYIGWIRSNTAFDRLPVIRAVRDVGILVVGLGSGVRLARSATVEYFRPAVKAIWGYALRTLTKTDVNRFSFGFFRDLSPSSEIFRRDP